MVANWLLTYPRRHENGAARQWVVVIPQIQQQSQRQSAPGAISGDDDVFWRNVEIVDQSKIRRHGVMQ